MEKKFRLWQWKSIHPPVLEKLMQVMYRSSEREREFI